jgi:hypothetical protein
VIRNKASSRGVFRRYTRSSGNQFMLPRFRFVVASLAIALLPMVLLGSGISPTPNMAATMEIPRADRPIVIGPDKYSEAQYRHDRMVFAYARRANELSRLRERASEPLAAWVAAPAGPEPEDAGDPKANEAKPVGPKASEVVATLSLATLSSELLAIDAPARPAADAAKAPLAMPELERPILSPSSAVSPSPVSTRPAPQVYVALNMGAGSGEVLRTQQPPVGYFAPLPKPKPKVVKRTGHIKRAAAKPAPIQQKPPFSDLFSWLFGQYAAAEAPAIALATASKTTAR